MGHELIDRLIAEGSDEAAGALLTVMHQGHPVSDLRPLFEHPDPAVVKAATWIASELGERAEPLLDAVPALLAHPLRYVRFFALDIVLAAAGTQHGELIARAAELCDDEDKAVRWKAMRLLARASEGQLGAATSHLRDERMRTLTTWLAAPSGIPARLADPDPVTRRFGAAAAVRTHSSLDEAAASSDPEIATFARDHLGGPSVMPS